MTDPLTPAEAAEVQRLRGRADAGHPAAILLAAVIDRYRRALEDGYSCPRCGWVDGDPFPLPRWGPCDICADARALLAEETD